MQDNSTISDLHSFMRCCKELLEGTTPAIADDGRIRLMSCLHSRFAKANTSSTHRHVFSHSDVQVIFSEEYLRLFGHPPAFRLPVTAQDDGASRRLSPSDTIVSKQELIQSLPALYVPPKNFRSRHYSWNAYVSIALAVVVGEFSNTEINSTFRNQHISAGTISKNTVREIILRVSSQARILNGLPAPLLVLLMLGGWLLSYLPRNRAQSTRNTLLIQGSRSLAFGFSRKIAGRFLVQAAAIMLGILRSGPTTEHPITAADPRPQFVDYHDRHQPNRLKPPPLEKLPLNRDRIKHANSTVKAAVSSEVSKIPAEIRLRLRDKILMIPLAWGGSTVPNISVFNDLGANNLCLNLSSKVGELQDDGTIQGRQGWESDKCEPHTLQQLSRSCLYRAGSNRYLFTDLAHSNGFEFGMAYVDSIVPRQLGSALDSKVPNYQDDKNLIDAVMLVLVVRFAVIESLLDGNRPAQTVMESIIPVLADHDNDGIPNFFEEDLGTSLVSNDSDDDKMSDGAEVLIAGTNPLARDSDGDGISDGQEWGPDTENSYRSDPLIWNNYSSIRQPETALCPEFLAIYEYTGEDKHIGIPVRVLSSDPQLADHSPARYLPGGLIRTRVAFFSRRFENGFPAPEFSEVAAIDPGRTFGYPWDLTWPVVDGRHEGLGYFLALPGQVPFLSHSGYAPLETLLHCDNSLRALKYSWPHPVNPPTEGAIDEDDLLILTAWERPVDSMRTRGASEIYIDAFSSVEEYANLRNAGWTYRAPAGRAWAPHCPTPKAD